MAKKTRKKATAKKSKKATKSGRASAKRSRKSARAERRELFLEFALAAAHDRREHLETRALLELEHAVAGAVDGGAGL